MLAPRRSYPRAYGHEQAHLRVLGGLVCFQGLDLRLNLGSTLLGRLRGALRLFKLLSSLPCSSFGLLYQWYEGLSGHLVKWKSNIYCHHMYVHLSLSTARLPYIEGQVCMQILYSSEPQGGAAPLQQPEPGVPLPAMQPLTAGAQLPQLCC